MEKTKGKKHKQTKEIGTLQTKREGKQALLMVPT
jgi:hypothetical protein